MNVLCICTGNYCRSQIAAAILESMAIPGIQVCSAGTSDWGVGKEPSLLVCQVIHELTGMDWTYEPRIMTDRDAAWADLILIMDSGHDTYMRTHYLGMVHNVKLLSELAGVVEDIPNPSHNDLAALRLAGAQIARYLCIGKGALAKKAVGLENAKPYMRKAP